MLENYNQRIMLAINYIYSYKALKNINHIKENYLVVTSILCDFSS